MLSGANTYSGGTTISGGHAVGEQRWHQTRWTTLERTPVVATASNIVLNGGTLEATAGFTLNSNRGIALVRPPAAAAARSTSLCSNTLTYGGIVANNGSGNGGLTLAGGGTLALSGANTYSGGTTIIGGTLQLGSSTALGAGDVTVNGGTLDINSFSETVPGLTLEFGSVIGTTGVLESTSAYQVQDGSIGAILGGSDGLDMTTNGEVTLSGANTYSGVTTISGGELFVSSDANLGADPGSPTPGSIALNGGTLVATASFTLNSNREIAVSPNSVGNFANIGVQGDVTLSYGGIVSGTGGLIVGGGGTFVLSGANTYSGGTVIYFCTLEVTNGGSLGSGSVTDYGGLVFNRSDTSTVVNSISGQGGLSMLGSGTVTLSGANTFTGTTVVEAGTLIVGNSTSAEPWTSSTEIDSGASADFMELNITDAPIENSGSVTLTGCSISGGSAVDGGGMNNSGTATLYDCTLSGNMASGNGGALYNTGTATLIGCTVAGNSASDGAGVYNPTGTLSLTDTIIAGNTAPAGGAASDVGGTGASGVSGSYNLIGDGGSGGISNGVNGDIVLTPQTEGSVGLSSLGNYGGPTETIALLPGSQAIGAGIEADFPGTAKPIITDQRGFPLDSPNPDIGAFQSNPLVVNTTVDGSGAPLGSLSCARRSIWRTSWARPSRSHSTRPYLLKPRRSP